MTKLALQIGDITISAETLREDLTYSEIFDLLKGLMVGHTYSEDCFYKQLRDYADET